MPIMCVNGNDKIKAPTIIKPKKLKNISFISRVRMMIPFYKNYLLNTKIYMGALYPFYIKSNQ